MSFSSDICFVGLKCYDFLTDAQVPRYLGGIEKMLVALARELSKTVRISFITYDHGQLKRQRNNNIEILSSFKPDEGFPLVRFFHPRMTRIWSAMKEADARVYVQMGAGCETGQVALGCKKMMSEGRKFVFFAASDDDCKTSLPHLKYFRERWLYRVGLKKADAVITQTESQKKMMSESFSLNSILVPTPSSSPSWRKSVRGFTGSRDILWVGRISEVKRLEWFLDVAEKCDDCRFHVIGAANAETGYQKNLLARAKTIGNVIVHGRLSDEELKKNYLEAGLLCSTSIVEGFPMTFLEAWSCGLPVVSTFDPDDVIRKNGLGMVAEGVDGVVRCVRQLLGDEAEWLNASAASLKYFDENHDIKAVAPRLARIFKEL